MIITAMSKTPQGQVRARGTCSEGHVTEVTTAPGRTTWEGPCGHDGCEQKVNKARRVRSDTPPVEPDDVAAVDDDTDRFRVIEVEGYDTAAGPAGGGAEHDDAEHDDAGGTEEPPPTAIDDGGPAEVSDPAAAAAAETRDRGGFGFRGRRRDRAERPDQPEHEDHFIPGIF